MKNVLIAYHQFPHYRQGIIDELTASDMNVVFFSGCRGDFDGIPSAVFDEEKVSIFYGKNLWFKGLLYQVGLIGLICSRKFDAIVLLANPNFISTWIAAILCRALRVRVIFWGHGFIDEDASFKNLVRKLFFSLANSLYVYGHRSKGIAIDYGFSKQRIYVGLNSLDYKRQLPLRLFLDGEIVSCDGLHFDESGGALKILCVSRLTKICDYDVLIRAVSIAKVNFGVNCQVIFIGDGPSKQGLELLCAELHVNARFLGAIYNEAVVSKWIYCADVVVSPGKVGLTAMHSLMYGTPVITHSSLSRQMPEVEAVIDGVTGGFFEKGSSESLANVLSKFESHLGKRNIVRQNCYRVIDYFYNPMFQFKVLADAINGAPASDYCITDAFKG